MFLAVSPQTRHLTAQNHSRKKEGLRVTTVSMECGICGHLSDTAFAFLQGHLFRPVTLTVAMPQWLLEANIL